MRSIFIAVMMLLSTAAGAQQIGLLAGGMDVVGTSDSSYAWSLEYRQHLAPHLDWSFAWLNEGHPAGHHRDGFAPQLWLTDTVLSPRFSLGIGAGPYRFFDTVRGPHGDAVDLNDWGWVVSVAAGWELSHRATLRLETVRTYTHSDIETRLYLVGLGWRLRQSDAPLVAAPGEPGGVARRTVEREAIGFAGVSVLNNFHSPRATAWGLQYRHGMGTHTDWSLSWLNEGRTRLTDRDGLAAQVWAENGYSRERLLLGVGAGPYLYVDQGGPDNGDRTRRGVAAMVSLSAAWRFGDRFITRLIWNRVASFYNQDADVIVLGVGISTPAG